MKSKPGRILLALVTLVLAGCGSTVVKESSPPIAKTIGKMDRPPEEVLPIIRSEPVAGDAEAAAENYRKLLELTPDVETRKEAQRRLADLQVQIQDSRGATEESEKALQEAISLYNKLLYADPNSENNDRIFYQLARAQQNIGETEAAIDTLKRLTDRHPKSALAGDARFRRAELLFAVGRYAEAEADYRVVMDLKDATPFFEPAQYKYGWSQYKQSKYEEAIGTFFDLLDRELPTGEPYEPEPALRQVDVDSADMARDALRVVTLALASLGGGSALNEYLQTHGDPRFYPLVYAALGEAMLDKERYSDAAGAYAAFIQRYPSSPLAPAFQSRIIAAYARGGFGDLVVREKERYATAYDPQADYWNGAPATEAVMHELRSHLEDLARHYHAKAQQAAVGSASAAGAGVNVGANDFRVAARWYRRIIDLYPQDPKLADIHFLLGDALLDGGEILAAARAYERTAYGYENYARAGEAAHASVLAYVKHARTVDAGSRPEALRAAVEAGIKLADNFPEHPHKLAVLTQAAQDLYELQAYDEAVTVAARVIQAQPVADAALRRIAWSVTGDAHFAQARFAEAEAAFSEELRLTPAQAPERADITEQLAVAVYRQGEAARAADDLKTAAFHFLRVGDVAPASSIRATAEYDGAAALIILEDWANAARVLEGFRQRFPGHALEADVDKKLAVAYQRDGKPLDAARTYARIARRDSETIEVRREAGWLAATLLDEGKADREAAAAYAYYVEIFAQPLERTIEARSRLVHYARASGDRDQLAYWLESLVDADTNAGAQRSNRSRSLAAEASLELGRMAARKATQIRLTLPIESSLPRKKQAMEDAIRWLDRAAGYGFAETTTAATFELGEVYRAFGRALMESERPRDLDGLELEQYELLLEEQAYPFEEQAIATHEANLQRLRSGLYDTWIARSARALADLTPARYGKREQAEDRYESLD
ncbi:tetratricopeptide repeat protein [Sinimarinibacterium thermocellulolyticum]|uniref:Tetratricopeptide repeat protein n=1 Tax=Sinimarinibacterium thermocellulolyticum TaxID=3170016 RepID=A0ABV2A565_9GAMM